MPNPQALIGKHPSSPHIFEKSFSYDDGKPTVRKKHRALAPAKNISEKDLIAWLGSKLVKYHYDEDSIKRLKKKYRKIGFSNYAKSKLPKLATTRKGNFAEILLTEYVESCQPKPVYKVFRLHYNPNVEQSMKGDDMLLVNIDTSKNKPVFRLIIGESKFRKVPNKDIVVEIVKGFPKNRKPLSLHFIVTLLSEDPGTEPYAEMLDDLILEGIKGKDEIIYAGFLLSNTNTEKVVNDNLDSGNEKFVMISLGINDPEGLVNKSFDSAAKIVLNPNKI